ncbi:MAG: hypothetical protein KDD22_00660 [Bdellovibrionales bacterium]|nr:hypothetical protein [Bdellovibrionales bacterium]
MKKLVLALALLGGFQATAALAPYYDSVKKIEVALSSTELADNMQMLNVESVSIQDQTVLVTNGNCTWAVDLGVETPSEGQVGATKYFVENVSSAMCTGAILPGR